MRKPLVFVITLLLVGCGRIGAMATEGENIRLAISQKSYSLSERIELKISAIGEGIWFHGPCDWWFERKTARGWEVIGECPRSNFADEPFPQQVGNEITISLPTSEEGNRYQYNYDLTTGTYRYALSYRVSGGTSISHSPEFEITADETE